MCHVWYYITILYVMYGHYIKKYYVLYYYIITILGMYAMFGLKFF